MKLAWFRLNIWSLRNISQQKKRRERKKKCRLSIIYQRLFTVFNRCHMAVFIKYWFNLKIYRDLLKERCYHWIRKEHSHKYAVKFCVQFILILSWFVKSNEQLSVNALQRVECHKWRWWFKKSPVRWFWYIAPLYFASLFSYSPRLPSLTVAFQRSRTNKDSH